MGQVPLFSLLISFLVLSIAHHSHSQQQCTSSSTGDPHQVRSGFWLSQSSRYSPISTINTSLYTHIYYCSLFLEQSNSGIAIAAPDPILGTFSTTLKSNNPSLITILSIATDDHQSDASNAAFSSMAADPALRNSFINSAIDLARANGFGGLDLAWQFPSLSNDMAELGNLLAEWRVRINEEAQSSSNSSNQLILTATVYFSNHLFDTTAQNLDYPVDAISANLDWINALCFGYHKNSNVTAADAALFDKASHFSTSYGITSWLDAGIPSCKLVMGIPLFGRSWILKNKVKNGPGDRVVAAGPRQRMSNQAGLMAYFEIKELLNDPSVYTFDSKAVFAYFHSGDLWVSFDSPEVVEEKIEFALRNRLLGYFLWPISFDDSTYTMSRQASDSWLENYDSPYFKDEDGFEQAHSPMQQPPQDNAPTPSAANSGSMQQFATFHNSHLICIFSCFFWFI